MTTLTAPKTLILAAGLLVAPLTGCATIERETGLNRSTQFGVGGGAAFGGIVAALADANPAWIAASIILGGVTGGFIGDALGREDTERHARTHLSSLNTLGEGQRESWKNTRTGNSGSTTVTAVKKEVDGRVCKSYTETVHAGSKTVTKDATACKNSGGSWKVTQA